MNWNEITHNIESFFNLPVPIIGCSVLFALIFCLVIISKTSIGTKILKRLTKMYDSLLLGFTNFKKKADQTLQEQKERYEREIAVIESKYNALQEFLVLIAENSHNKKIEEGYKKYVDLIDNSKTHYEEILNEKVEAKIEEFKNGEIATFKTEFDKTLEEFRNKANSTLNDIENHDDQRDAEQYFLKFLEWYKNNKESQEEIVDEREEPKDTNGTEEISQES